MTLCFAFAVRVLKNLALLLALSIGLGRIEAAETAGRPNVIVILTDDQGSVDAGCYGAKDIETPHIDELARRGVRFTQFYAGAPVCSPSRAALLTGRYPIRAGLTGNASSRSGHGSGMPGRQVTLAEMLKAAGYATAHIGKWHLGYTEPMMPNAQGFDHSFGHMGGCIDNYSHFFYWNGPNRHDLHRNGEEVHHPGEYFPGLMVKEAREFMRKHREEPFFIYFALNTPHYPYQGSPEWLEYYKDLPYPRNLYAAFLSTMDEHIGELLGAVDDLGLRERTIIIFQSDHGHSTEERAHGGGGSAGPFRGAKFSLFEGGIRVPAIISWPGRLPENQVRGQMAHSCDWLPTIAELCGVPLLNEDIDGSSLVEVLRSAEAAPPHERLHWFVGSGKRAQWAVREGDWKLIGNVVDTSGGELTPEDKNLFLVNLADDPGETHNLAEQNSRMRQHLLERQQEWMAEARR